MTALVQERRDRDLAVLTLDHPQLNILDAATRAAMIEALDRAEEDAAVAAILIEASGHSFCGGAPLNELEAPEPAPSLAALCQRVEDCGKPVIALLQGAVLYGGFALALAVHYRIADPGVQIGCPEVTLGLIPAGGVTHRLSRIIGPEVALELMMGGATITSGRAAELELIDRIAADPPGADARGFVRKLLADGAGPRRAADRTGRSAAAGVLAAVAAARARAAASPLLAPGKIADCVEAGLLLPPPALLDFEAAAFEDCRASAQSAALRHLARAERRAIRSPGGPDGVPPGVIGVVGSSPQAVSNAANALARGLRVVLAESDGASAADMRDRIGEFLSRAGAASSTMDRLRVEADLEALADTDVVLEARADTSSAKAAVWGELGGLLPARVPVFTVSDMEYPAAALKAPDLADRLVALRYAGALGGSHVVEVAGGPDLRVDARRKAVALVRALGRLVINTGMGGPVGDQVLAAGRKAALVLLEEGAGPAAVDAALREWGFLRGIFETIDDEELDSARTTRLQDMASAWAEPRGDEILAALIALGRLGGENGRGFFGGPSARGTDDADMTLVLKETRSAKGLIARRFGAEEIRQRVLYAMANAGARLLRTGIAMTSGDVDLVMIHANGFPRRRGGPMHNADTDGLLSVRDALRGFAEDAPGIWTPDPLFSELIKQGRRFSDPRG